LWFLGHIIPKELYQIEYASMDYCISSWKISKVMLSSLIGCHLTFQHDVWLMMTLFGKLCSNFSNGHKFNKFSFIKEYKFNLLYPFSKSFQWATNQLIWTRFISPNLISNNRALSFIWISVSNLSSSKLACFHLPQPWSQNLLWIYWNKISCK
jgi:hypothetical protein